VMCPLNFGRRAALWLCLAGIFAVGLGCGPKEKVREYGKIKGKVLWKGKPLDHGTVIFQHVEGPTVDAPIASDGSYETNAVVGDTRVAVNCREPDVQEGGVRQELVPGKSIIPPKYGSTETSGLKYMIVPGEDTWDIKIE